MSANKLTTAQEYVRSNYVETGRLRYDLLSQKLQVAPQPPKGGVGNEELNRLRLNDEMMNWELIQDGASTYRLEARVWTDLDTRWINTLAVECANETGVNVTDKEIRIVLNSHVVPAINPLRDWLLSLPDYTPGNQSFIDWLAAQVHVKSNLSQNSQNPQTESTASQAQSSPKAQHDGLASQAQECYSPQSPTQLAEQEKNNICGEQKKNNICAKQKRDSITICELGDEEPRDSYRSLAEANSLRTVPQSGTTMPLEKSAKSASSARAIILRVDTVFVERWHTQTIPSAIALRAHNSRNGAPSTILRFYKNCTWGFFILLLLILGRFAFRIAKAIYLRR